MNYITRFPSYLLRFIEVYGIFPHILSSVPPHPPPDGTLQWHIQAEGGLDCEMTVYIDGSGQLTNLPGIARFGYAITAISAQGQLVALASGVPPEWVTDSGAAEIWAFLQVLRQWPGFPNIVTDYLGIVQALTKTYDTLVNHAAGTTANCGHAQVEGHIAHIFPT